LFPNYIDCVNAYAQDEKTGSTFTGPSNEPDDGMRREIERRIAIGSAATDQRRG